MPPHPKVAGHPTKGAHCRIVRPAAARPKTAPCSYNHELMPHLKHYWLHQSPGEIWAPAESMGLFRPDHLVFFETPYGILARFSNLLD
jgi:hypothetical protein